MDFAWLLKQHGILFGALSLVFMITAHELGHYFAARAAGIRIFEFSLGFGPTLYKKIDSKGVTWSIRAIPLGGFVHMHRREPKFGEEKNEEIADGEYLLFTWIRTRITYKDGQPVDDGTDEEETKSLYHPSNVDPQGKPIRSIALEDVSFGWQAVVLLAGIGMNILFAAACFSASFVAGFDVVARDGGFDAYPAHITVTKENIAAISTDRRVVVDALDVEGMAADVGLQVGDVIMAIDGAPVTTPEEALAAIEPTWRGQDFVIRFGRGNEVFDLAYLPEYLDEDRPAEEVGGECDPGDEVPWAYYDNEMTLATMGRISLPIMGGMVLGTVEAAAGTYLSVALTADAIANIFRQPEEVMNGVSGPVGTVVMMDQFAASGLAVFLQIAGLVSLSIAAFNFMPLPALDGGQLILLAVQRVLGRFSFYKYLDLIVKLLGTLLLIGAGIAITCHDIFALF